MIITKDMLDEKVPRDKFPTRLDSAINLYAYIKGKGIVLYNVNPTTWNCLYPFYELEHKFMLDDYKFSSIDMTYRELLSEYQKQYHTIYEEKVGYSKERRKDILLSQYQKTFHLNSATIGDELEAFYELKYSKSQNVWTLYYFENYVVDKIETLEKLLSQNQYPQEFLEIDKIAPSINGISVVENVLYILSNDSNLKKMEQNVLVDKEY